MPITLNGTTGVVTPGATVGSITGILKATSGVVSQAVAGTDFPDNIQASKAWVNFNGTTSPGTIRSSYNVSSITKNGTGDYTVNFTTPMTDADYSIVATANSNYGNQSYIIVTLAGTGSVTSGPAALKTTTQVRIFTGTGTGLLFDVQNISAIIFGN